MTHQELPAPAPRKRTTKRSAKKTPPPPPSRPAEPPWVSALQSRLQRAEGLLDSWMDRYEANLLEANPDASKVAELVNIFTLLKRILEIQDLQHKLLKNESAPANDQSPDSFVLHSALFGDGISSSSENEPDE